MKIPNSLEKYASKYFKTTIEIVKNDNNLVTLKFFCFENNITLCGIKFVKEIIKKEIDSKVLKEIEIFALSDGAIINAHQPVLTITGKYRYFALLEGIIDGILTRLSSIATNVRKIINLKGDVDLVYMADRNDLYLNQPYDGYAAYIGGARKFVTEAMLEFIDDTNVECVGTMPHSLIQQSEGDTLLALIRFHETYPKIKITALIDYSNDCVGEIKKIAAHPIAKFVNAVRVDTSVNLVDKILQVGNWQNDLTIRGVCTKLIFKVREALDNHSLKDVKIIVSGSINDEKIKQYNKEKAPIDIYGIGSWLLKKSCHFTGDLIKLNGVYQAKIGRNNDIEQYLIKMKKWSL